jgi:hypothetical protein
MSQLFRLLVVMCLLIVAVVALYPDDQKALSACDVLTRLQDYRNKIVVVRGLLFSTSERTYLKPLSTESCASFVRFFDYEWSDPVFNLAVPGPSGTADDKSLPPYTYTVAREISDPAFAKSDRVVLVTGRIESRENLTFVLMPSGTKIPYGYGHLNAAIAQIVYSRIEPDSIASAAKP